MKEELHTRRSFATNCCSGLAAVALTHMLAKSGGTSEPTNPLSSKPPHFEGKAKRIIFLFMHGGVSQVDTFDYKPLLHRDHEKPLPFEKPRVQFGTTANLYRSPWSFQQYGQSGAWVSELFPHVGQMVDNLCFIKSLHGSNEAHGGALLKIHTGSDTFVRPSIGSWISYGLGTENENLPSFITINPTLGHGGIQNFSASFLPAVHQGTRIGKRGDSTKDVSISNLRNQQINAAQQRRELALLQKLNRKQLERSGPDPSLEARIQSFELAYRMQSEAPQLFDLDSESASTMRTYGIDSKETENFGRQCLLARRLAESGVRFIQCTHGYWDQHSDLKEKHTELSKQVDKPIAGLLRDLKARGMLDDTLVIWGTEFGRTPTAQNKNGRDHNPHGFTWWMAGAGVKPGTTYGSTDDYGYYSTEDKVHVHDLHATILHLLGLDHEQLTFRYGGRDFRLTDVEGRVVTEILN